MKKLLPFCILCLITISCSEDEPQDLSTLEEMFYEIEAGETKVEEYTIEFEGKYVAEYEITEMILNDSADPVPGELKDYGSFAVDGQYTLEIDGGFDYVELEFSNITEEGSFSVTLNGTKEHIPFHHANKNNLSPDFLIPYKY